MFASPSLRAVSLRHGLRPAVWTPSTPPSLLKAAACSAAAPYMRPSPLCGRVALLGASRSFHASRHLGAGKKSKAALAAAVAAGDGRSSALTAALKQIKSQYGAGAVMQLGDHASTANGIEVISTGSLTLDKALGIGGLPKGRVVEIYGPESSGKTTLALHVIAEAQKQDLNCTFIDVEHAIDPSYARALGVDIDSLYLSQPDAGEQALEIADTLVRSGAMDVVVVDSVAALVPKAELEGEMGDHHMALQARLMSQALRKLNASLMQSPGCIIIFINQIRSKVGVLFGSPDVTSGGNALKFYASVRLDIRRIGQIKDGDAVVGNRTRVKVVKNKVAPPFREAEFDMTYGFGIDRVGELVDVGVQSGVLTKSGSWFSWSDGDNIAQGREKTKQFFADDKEAAEQLNAAIKAAAAPAPEVDVEAVDADTAAAAAVAAAEAAVDADAAAAAVNAAVPQVKVP